MVPVTASITASFMSALTLLGIPAEVYTQVLCCTVLNCAVLYCAVLYCTVQGTMILVILAATPLICLISGWVFIPTFHRLQLQSSYQYLQLR